MKETIKIKNKETNIKLELSAGIIALIVSWIFVFSNRIGNFYQISYVFMVFGIHQIIQAIIYNKWNFDFEFNFKKIALRCLIAFFILIIAFMDLGSINKDYSYYFGFTNDKPRNTFLSIVLYCGVYLVIYFLRLKMINKKVDKSL